MNLNHNTDKRNGDKFNASEWNRIAEDVNQIGRQLDTYLPVGDYAPASNTPRIVALENAVGNGGSIDERIDSVRTELNSSISSEQTARLNADNEHDIQLANRYTKAEVDNIVSRTPETDVIIIDVPTASLNNISAWLNANTPSGTDPQTGKSVRANKLYRVPGPTNSAFSEWAWNGTLYIMMANKDYGVDDKPTTSNNLIKSRGVYEIVENISEEIKLAETEKVEGKFWEDDGEQPNEYMYYKRFRVKGGKTYKISSYFDSHTDIYFVVYVDSLDNFISHDYFGTLEEEDPKRLEKAITRAPENAAYALLNSYLYNEKDAEMYEVGDTILSRNLEDNVKIINTNLTTTSSTMTPSYTGIDKYYYKDGEHSQSGFIYKRYNVTGGKTYKFTSYLGINCTIYFIVWTDSLNNVIDCYKRGSETEEIYMNKASVKAPSKAAYAYLNAYYSDRGIRPFMYENLEGMEVEEKLSELEKKLAVFKEKISLVPEFEVDSSFIKTDSSIASHDSMKVSVYNVSPLAYYSFSGDVDSGYHSYCYLNWYDNRDNYLTGDLYIENNKGKVVNKIVQAPYNAVKVKVNILKSKIKDHSFEEVMIGENYNGRSVMSRGYLSPCNLSEVITLGKWLLIDSNTYIDVPENTTVGFFEVSRYEGWVLQEFLDWTNKYYKRLFRIDLTPGNWNLVSGGGNEYHTNNLFTNILLTVNLTATPLITSDTNNYLAPSGNSSDRTADILAMLQSTGICRLGAGDYYIDSLVMPSDSCIIGSGKKTCIKLISGDNKFAVKMGSNCTIENLSLDGLDSSTPTSTIGTRHGILWLGNYSQIQNSEQQPFESFVSNVYIFRFNGGGITCVDTGYGTRNCISANNIYIEKCSVGINISYWSEFNKFTNIRCYKNYYGCINNGGNNMFVNCDFSESLGIAFLMDNLAGLSPNNSHGSCVGCIFNHTANNTGIGIKILNCDNGFAFNGCQIFFSKIDIEDSDGVVFSSCIFGANNCDIKVVGGGVILFSNNLHSGIPQIDIISNNNVHFTNCYVRSTGVIVTN